MSSDVSPETLGPAFEACPNAMLLVSANGTICRANAQAEVLFGYARGELQDRPVDLLLPRSAGRDHPGHMAAYFRDPTVRAMGAGRDLTGRRKDGTEVPIEIGLNPLPSPPGRYVLASVVDISLRKEMEQDLRDSETQQRQIVEAAPNAMIMVDERGAMVSVNSQAEQLFGFPRDQLVGRTIEMLVPERFRASHPADRDLYWARAETRPMGAGRDLFGLRSDGTEVPIEIGLNPLTTSAGKFVLASIIDITGRKRHEDLLRASLAEKEMLLREIHHRVKNNMQVVSSILSLQSAKIPTPEYRAMLVECQRRVRTMALIHEKLYRTGSPAIDCGAYVRELTQMSLSSQVPGRSTIALDLETDHVPIDAQAAIPVGLLLHELVANAMKHAFGPHGEGRLSVSLRRDGDTHVCLVVADDGPGLPSLDTRGQGSGIGLRMVRTLAAQIDGEIQLDRSSGTRISVRFPLNRSPDGRGPRTTERTGV